MTKLEVTFSESGIGSGCQSRVPIFPDRLITEAANEVGDFAGAAFVGDIELAGGVRVRAGSRPFAGAQFDNASALGMMEFLLACSGVAAGFSVAAGAHQGNAKGNEAIAKAGGFACRKDESDIGKHDPKSANQLHEFAVGHMREGLKFAGARTESGKGDGQLSFPAFAQ